jgi:hypothetical protein
MRNSIRTSFSVLLFVAGVNIPLQAQQGPQPTQEPTVYKGVTDASCAVEISFGSYGAGIDGKALEKVESAISKYKLKNTRQQIGREGELRICLPLKELKAKKKASLINELKKIAKEGQLVSVSIR